jgi:methyl-accepting chemotaxis protein
MGFLTASRDANAKLDALNRSQAVIEFNLDGTIIAANQNFLNAVGYTLEEIRGKHHSMFVDPDQRDSAEYRGFWDALRRGEYQAREFKRVAKGGRPLWIQASYNPLMNARGKPYKVVKFATDITDQKLRNADNEGQLKAIHKSQAVIEFNLDGTIITANDNFLKTLGYSLDEIRGRHHRLFVEPQERESTAYRAFWEALGRGEYQAAEYKRSERVAGQSGFRRPTIRSMMPTARS